MSIQDTANLIAVKQRVLHIEHEVQIFLLELSKKQKTQISRPRDYGVRGVHLHILFDEINLEALKKLENIKEIYKEYTELRNKQKELEQTYDEESATRGQIIKDLQRRQ